LVAKPLCELLDNLGTFDKVINYTEELKKFFDFRLKKQKEKLGSYQSVELDSQKKSKSQTKSLTKWFRDACYYVCYCVRQEKFYIFLISYFFFKDKNQVDKMPLVQPVLFDEVILKY
jgi:hypothetical protein